MKHEQVSSNLKDSYGRRINLTSKTLLEQTKNRLEQERARSMIRLNDNGKVEMKCSDHYELIRLLDEILQNLEDKQ